MLALASAIFGTEVFKLIQVVPSPLDSCMAFAEVGRVWSRTVASPLSNEYGTYKTVKARFWPWLSG